MKKIKLTQGKFALVDDEDYEYLNQWKWHIIKCKKTFYVRRVEIFNKKRKHILMHRIILNPPENMDIDHWDHNGLNNQRINLRIVTNQQNQFNRQLRKNTSSFFKGVHWHKKNKVWRTTIKYNGREIHLGCFDNEIDGAIAYNQKAKELFGEFACLNPIPKKYKDRKPVKRKVRTSSKYLYVYWHKTTQKWQAQIYKNKKYHHLGLFNSEEEAHEAILKEKQLTK